MAKLERINQCILFMGTDLTQPGKKRKRRRWMDGQMDANPNAKFDKKNQTLITVGTKFISMPD